MINLGPGRREPRPAPLYGEGASQKGNENRPLYQEVSPIEGGIQRKELESELASSGVSKVIIKRVIELIAISSGAAGIAALPATAIISIPLIGITLLILEGSYRSIGMESEAQQLGNAKKNIENWTPKNLKPLPKQGSN